MTATSHPLILASTSRYRRELLERLRVPFAVCAPDVDETPRAGEAPAALALRLARAKTQEVAARHPQAWVIGSDQVAELDGAALGKPGTPERACAQLAQLAGRAAVFHTAVAVAAPDGALEAELVPVAVRFRALTSEDIATYVRLDNPLDCAGSAKCETLGIALLDAVDSSDPTALIGLPLIATTRLLRAAGFDVLALAR